MSAMSPRISETPHKSLSHSIACRTFDHFNLLFFQRSLNRARHRHRHTRTQRVRRMSTKQTKMYLSRTASALAVLLVVLAAIGTVQSQFPEKLTQNPCVSKTSCHDCIQTKNCAWCMQPDFGEKPRCFQPSMTAFIGGCPVEYTWNPDYEFTTYESEQLTRTKGGMEAGGGQMMSGGSIEETKTSGSWYHEHSESSGGSYHHSSSSSSGGSRYSGSSSGKIVQIYPQRVGLKLRISKSQSGQP